MTIVKLYTLIMLVFLMSIKVTRSFQTDKRDDYDDYDDYPNSHSPTKDKGMAANMYETLIPQKQSNHGNFPFHGQSRKVASIDESTDAPNNQSTEAPNNQLTQTPPNNEFIDTPNDEMTNTPNHELTTTPANEMTDTPKDELTNTPANEMTDTRNNELTNTQANEMTDAPNNELTNTPDNEMTDTPKDELTNKPANKMTDSPVHNSTGTRADVPRDRLKVFINLQVKFPVIPLTFLLNKDVPGEKLGRSNSYTSGTSGQYIHRLIPDYEDFNNDMSAYTSGDLLSYKRPIFRMVPYPPSFKEDMPGFIPVDPFQTTYF